MAAALAVGERGRGRTAPNPNVGCVIVRDGVVAGRGWTQPGGRPHAEAMALAQAGPAARGATAYVTLEPCAHDSTRGPACSDLLIAAGVTRVVTALTDPDPRTAGAGHRRLAAAGIAIAADIAVAAARRSMVGFLTRQALGRPSVTLKLATSADGRIAAAPGADRWLTGPVARAHGHIERTRHEAILVGRGTFDADMPRLDVRLPGLEARSPRRLLLTRGAAPAGWEALPDPEAIAGLTGVDHLLVEGGGQTAAAFLAADLVDRILWYRAPLVVGTGDDIADRLGLPGLADSRAWAQIDTRTLG
jgi:diaminohydroxyphosphoribosylaminopyrimidine deaminase/5-amino-6-(5-phosphoribosylamino)uracil reductase